MACRNLVKAESVRQEILRENPSANLKLLKFNLFSLQSVKECAETFLQGSLTNCIEKFTNVAKLFCVSYFRFY